jgi:divinyl protochlorophyllide a 8-vinyl-reductase
MGHTAFIEGAARVGPNAVTQLAAALRRAGLDELCTRSFVAAGVPDWLTAPPQSMIGEREAARLHHAVRALLPADRAASVMADAGRATADYLLRVRIPRFAQILLKLLPPILAAHLLVRAIRANAWTFAGSGAFTARAGRPTVLQIAHNPFCEGETAQAPLCVWHQAVFQRLFEVLVSPRATVREVACTAAGDGHCQFIVEY